MTSRVIALFLILLALTPPNVARSQTPAKTPSMVEGSTSSPPGLPAGQSTELSGAFLALKEKPYVYRPLDTDFWERISSYRKEGNPIGMIVEGSKHSEEMGELTPDGSEGRLAMALGFRDKNLNYAAFLVLTELAKSRAGTSMGEAALNELSEMAILGHTDSEAVELLLTTNEFGPLHPDIQSFVSYHRYLYNLRFGFDRWAKVQKGKIKKGSPWDYQLRYWQAIGNVARGKMDKAEPEFENLKGDINTPKLIKEWVTIQQARNLFEKGRFEEAYKLYREPSNLGVREKGRLLLEVAWSEYYLKHYDRALGLLHALRAPYFSPSLTPERYILEIIIYRDLCHYEAVDSAVKNFKESFKNSFLAIRKRLPLREDPTLVNLALLDRDLQDKANLIHTLRREKDEISKYNWDSFRFFKPMLDDYDRRDKTLQRQLDLVLEPRVREIAEFLLDTEEQVQFLDYTSKLDALRIVRAGEDRDYKSQVITYLTFESIFWPVENEFWWDEFDDFKVLISSRCSMSQNPGDEKMERDFE